MHMFYMKNCKHLKELKTALTTIYSCLVNVCNCASFRCDKCKETY